MQEPVVMKKMTLQIAEVMGISYSEAEEEVKRVFREQILATLKPLLKTQVEAFIARRGA